MCTIAGRHASERQADKFETPKFAGHRDPTHTSLRSFAVSILHHRSNRQWRIATLRNRQPFQSHVEAIQRTQNRPDLDLPTADWASIPTRSSHSPAVKGGAQLSLWYQAPTRPVMDKA